jgi:hypothetical protein
MAFLAALAVGLVAAAAPVQVDRENGVRFELTGRALTVTLVEPSVSSEPTTEEVVWGERIRAVCSARFGNWPRAKVVAVQTWPSDTEQLTYTFGRDISERVKWCLIESADDGGGDVAAVDYAVFFPVRGTTAADRRIGRKLRGYLWRNVGTEPWLRRVTGIVVDDRVISVTTQLRRNRRGEQVSRWLCQLIQGADVADFTPGHTVFGRGDVVVRACPARRE